MKYMNYNNSCSYAGIANLLEDFKINIEDYDLARQIHSPFIYKMDNESYITGFMNQREDDFNYFLITKGLLNIESMQSRENVVQFLKENTNVMVGLKSKNGRHAYIVKKYENGYFTLINNKRESDEEELIQKISDKEMIERIPSDNLKGILCSRIIKIEENTPYFEDLKKKYLDNHKHNLRCLQ